MKNFFTILAILFLSSGTMAQSVSLSRQTQGATFGEKVNAGLAVAAPGQPLCGIVIKGGKYATANTISVVTNAAGQFSFTVNEGGNYILNFQTGENPLFDNTGQAGANPIQSSALRATPGTPIGGIIVKGGKNPGGSFITLHTDEKGMLELPDLTPGTYTFKVTPKVVKATSGLKDTLKTQV
ncbi:hypothetical protein [Pedobacter sp. MC2016-24]|uniref:hypothetical protein n=1 Tax=Pedobacter sp. MC2016-24 TaxID=2780090 RepID=UPI00188267A0|nr:hypothetical protein [Pedobacter sp. MC2016-24]MBE9598008.1 hypothetical protein [Pedobacter sp. MC2016-24]